MLFFLGNIFYSYIVARGLEIELERLGTEESYFKSLPTQLESKRDYMAKFLVATRILFLKIYFLMKLNVLSI